MDKTVALGQLRRLLPRPIKSLLVIVRGLSQGKWPLALAEYNLRKSSDTVTLNGKIRFKMAYDRDPRLITFADKLKAREFVSSAIGSQYLPNLISRVGSDDDLGRVILPNEFALKSNNGSGAMILVWSGAPKVSKLPARARKTDWDKYLIHPDSFDETRASEIARGWLRQNFYYRPGYFPEWAYRYIEPALLIEEIMLDKDGSLPADYKFFMVGGACEFVQVDSSRYQKHTRDLFTANWERINGTYKYPPSGIDLQPPQKLQEMLEVAESLSQGIDFLRVDLYETTQGVKFGELTNYPGGGIEKFTPNSLDKELGVRWLPSYQSQQLNT